MEAAGRPSDPWQADVLDGAMGERPDGRWAASEVGLIVPRQNGKGDVLMAKALHSMYLSPVKLILWSAHEFKTVREMFLRVRETIDGCHDLSRRVKTIRTSHGEEGVELLDGTRLGFVARSRGSGRGFSPEELLWDEAYALTDEQVSAQMPSASAQPNPQIWYASSHPLALSTVLRRICRRGRAGGLGMAYYDWSADPLTTATPPTDPADMAAFMDQLTAAVREANPAYGIRIREDSILRELGSMDPDDFRRERLGIVNLDDDANQLVDPTVWAGLADTESKTTDPVAFAVDITPDRSTASISVAGYRDDGFRHNEVVDRRSGTRWIVARVVELVERWRPCAVALDPSSPAGSLIPELERKGIATNPERDETQLALVGATEMSQAMGAWLDAVEAGDIRHLDQTSLNTALAGAKERDSGDGAKRPSRKDSTIDISPWVSVMLADHALALYGDTGDTDVSENVW